MIEQINVTIRFQNFPEEKPSEAVWKPSDSDDEDLS